MITSRYQKSIKRQIKMMESSSFLKLLEEEDETMLENFERIKDINRLGYLTVESQAGLEREGTNEQTGKEYHISERAYIAGFMPESVASSFIRFMSIHTDKIVQYVPQVEDTTYLPSELDVPLTISEDASEDKDGGETKVATHMSPALPKSVWNDWRKQCHISKKERVVFVECYDPKWNRHAMSCNGLFTDVFSVLNILVGV